MQNQKMDAERLLSAQQVIEAVEVHGATIEAGVQRALTLPDLDVNALLNGLKIKLEGTASALRDASEAYQAELDDDADVRDARDAQVKRTYDAIVQARRAIQGAYGRSALTAIGQSGRLPERPDKIVLAARALVAKAPPVLSERPTGPGVQVDLAALIAPTAAALPDLEAAIKAVQREVREAEAMLATRDRVRADFDQAFTRCAGALAALFRLADQPKLADRIRPSRRRPGRTVVVANEGDDGRIDTEEAGDA